MTTDERRNDPDEQGSKEDEAEDDEQRKRDELDLHLENRALEDDLKAMGMLEFGKIGDLDPMIENQFLKYVEMYEEMEDLPKDPISSLFPADFVFPPAGQMTDAELEAKLSAIEEVLSKKRIFLQLQPGVPARDVYDYVVGEVLDYEISCADPTEEFAQIVDGCGGDCPSCFQRPYCNVAKEYESGPNDIPPE